MYIGQILSATSCPEGSRTTAQLAQTGFLVLEGCSLKPLLCVRNPGIYQQVTVTWSTTLHAVQHIKIFSTYRKAVRTTGEASITQLTTSVSLFSLSYILDSSQIEVRLCLGQEFPRLFLDGLIHILIRVLSRESYTISLGLRLRGFKLLNSPLSTLHALKAFLMYPRSLPRPKFATLSNFPNIPNFEFFCQWIEEFF